MEEFKERWERIEDVNMDVIRRELEDMKKREDE